MYVCNRDVSNEAMRNQDVSGLWKLTFLTSSLSLFPLCFLYLLPASKEAQESLGKSQERNRIGGICFLVVLFGSILYSVITAIYRVSLAMDVE